MVSNWKNFGLWNDTTKDEFADSNWQDKNAIIRMQQLEVALAGIVAPHLIHEIKAGLLKVGMSIRLTPYTICLIDWSEAETDPVRRQFLPLAEELENDHPCLLIDSLEEQDHSPVPGLVHRYPDKVLFLVTSVCPVYCQYCTRSYAVGMDTPLVHKEHVTSAKNWQAALDYIRAHREVEDVVVSGGDVSRLKAANVSKLGNALLDIEHVRRIRFATKAVSVQPMKFLSDREWTRALLGVVRRGRKMFKDVCIHTHFNHPYEVTPMVEQAMRRLHEEGVVVRNQAVLLRGVNDDVETLVALIKKLGRVNIHPYYAYLCDMVKGTEHFRVPLTTAQRLEKEVRGSTAGFNTPLFVVDTPAGKRDIHSAEYHDLKYGISAFIAPAVSPGRHFHYFDPLRSLSQGGRDAWLAKSPDEILDGVRRAAYEGVPAFYATPAQATSDTSLRS